MTHDAKYPPAPVTHTLCFPSTSVISLSLPLSLLFSSVIIPLILMSTLAKRAQWYFSVSSIIKHGGSNGLKINHGGKKYKEKENKAREKYKGNQTHMKRTKYINRVGPTCMVVSCDQPLKPASCS